LAPALRSRKLSFDSAKKLAKRTFKTLAAGACERN